MSGVKKQLAESQENQTKSESKMSHVHANLRALQDEKAAIEAKLSQKQAAFQAQV